MLLLTDWFRVITEMLSWKTKALQLALNGLYFTAAHRLLQSLSRGVGTILTLHRVRATTLPDFCPNRILEITPEFLDIAIRAVLEEGYEVVTLDEAKRRLVEADFEKRFVCFTLDDGYLDNYTDAFPVFSAHGVPFTVYVTTGLIEGTAILWWQHLEDIIAAREKVTFRCANETQEFSTLSTAAKYRAFNAIYWTLRAQPHALQIATLKAFFEEHDVDTQALCRRSALSWEHVRSLANSGLATIGAHTISHYAMAKLSEADAVEEVDASRRVIAGKTGIEPRHFAYPYGDSGSAGSREFSIVRSLGFDTATTTRKGVLFPEHAAHLHALPRVSLNGDYQTARYVRLFLSGVPFALRRRFRHLDVK